MCAGSGLPTAAKNSASCCDGLGKAFTMLFFKVYNFTSEHGQYLQGWGRWGLGHRPCPASSLTAPLPFLCLFSLQQKTPAAPSQPTIIQPSEPSARLGCRDLMGHVLGSPRAGPSVQGLGGLAHLPPWPSRPRRDQAPCGQPLALPSPWPPSLAGHSTERRAPGAPE